MKKSLIALAVLAASGAAMAQSSVTIYGLADVWIGSEKVNGVSNTKLDSGGASGFNTSRLGFKGTEDLGGGLKANFTIETAFSPDAPTATTLGSRVASVGLAGGFGSIELGKTWTPYDDTRAMANDTFNANLASSFSTWLGYEDNPNNQIRYNTPSIAGFTASLAYALGEDKTVANGTSNITSLSINYANGPIVAGFAHQSEKDNGSATPATTDITDNTGLRTTAAGKATYNLLNGSYDLGVAKLIAGYNTVKVTQVGSAVQFKANEYNLGVDAPLGANLSVGVGYARSKVEQNNVNTRKSTGYSVALKYALSKRTFTYAAVTQTKTDFVNPATADTKTSRALVGIQHAF